MTSLLDEYTRETDTPRTTFTDQERYEWIRGHRGDPLIDRALSGSNFDADFDRHIDEAIARFRAGDRQPFVGRAALATEVMARRRGETASQIAAPPRQPYRPSAFERRDDDADSWTRGRMQGEQNLH